MRAPVSVVIPTLNAAASLPDCLASLVEGIEAGLIRELIISDGGSSDGTLALADAWGADIVEGAPSRGGQLRRGCAAAQGQWLLILHADSLLDQGWTLEARAQLQNDGAAWFQLRFDRGGRLVARWANLRARLGLPYGDQGLLLPRTLYAQVGGYPDIPLMEDVAIVRALRGRLQGLDAQIETSADKYRRDGWFRRGGRNLWTLARYFAGVSPDQLARRYNRL